MKDVYFLKANEMKGINKSSYVLSDQAFKTLMETVKIPKEVLLQETMFFYNGQNWHAIEANLIQKYLPVNTNI